MLLFGNLEREKKLHKQMGIQNSTVEIFPEEFVASNDQTKSLEEDTTTLDRDPDSNYVTLDIEGNASEHSNRSQHAFKGKVSEYANNDQNVFKRNSLDYDNMNANIRKSNSVEYANNDQNVFK
eukprot:Awhi_evm1s8390